MTLPDLEVPLIYSLHYGQQGRQDCEDELPLETMGRMRKQAKGKSNIDTQEDCSEKLESMNLDTRRSNLIEKYHDVFGALPPPLSCRKTGPDGPQTQTEFEGSVVRRRPHPAAQDRIDEIERHIRECIDAGLSKEYKYADCPRHCSPCFLVAKRGSAAMRLVVDYGEFNKKSQNH